MYILTQGRDTIINMDITKEISINKSMYIMTTDAVNKGTSSYMHADATCIGKYKTKQRAEDILSAIIECDSMAYVMPKE